MRLVPSTPDLLSIDTMIAIREQVADELRGSVTKLEEIRLLAFERALQHIGIDDNGLAAHLSAFYLKRRFEDIQVFDDVLPTLETLHQYHELGILSNGNSYPKRCGLEGRFQFVVLSQDYGIEKPDPRLFEIAMRQVECAKHELLHVGDSLQSDVGGAKRAGVRSVWLNRDRKRNDSDIQTDFEILSLTQLVDICDRRGTRQYHYLIFPQPVISQTLAEKSSRSRYPSEINSSVHPRRWVDGGIDST